MFVYIFVKPFFSILCQMSSRSNIASNTECNACRSIRSIILIKKSYCYIPFTVLKKQCIFCANQGDHANFMKNEIIFKIHMNSHLFHFNIINRNIIEKNRSSKKEKRCTTKKNNKKLFLLSKRDKLNEMVCYRVKFRSDKRQLTTGSGLTENTNFRNSFRNVITSLHAKQFRMKKREKLGKLIQFCFPTKINYTLLHAITCDYMTLRILQTCLLMCVHMASCR